MCQFIMDLQSRVVRDRGVEAQILERLSLPTGFRIGLWHRAAAAPSDLQHNDLLKVVSSRDEEPKSFIVSLRPAFLHEVTSAGLPTRNRKSRPEALSKNP